MNMKRTRLAIIGVSAFLLLSGCQGFGRSSYDEKEYVSENLVEVLEIEDKNIPVTVVGVDESQPVTITYYENKNETYTIDDQNNKLVIKKNEPKKGWSIFSWFNFNFGKGAEVMVEVPSSQLSSLNVKTSNNKISVENISTNNAKLESSNGKIHLEDIQAANKAEVMVEVPSSQLSSLNVKTSNNKISVENISTNNAKLESSNGKIHLEDIQAANKIEGKTNNSKIELDDVNAKEIDFKTSNGKIDLSELSFSDGRFETSNGKISFDELSVKSYLSIKSSNGSIKGTIAGKQNDFSVESKTSNGKNNLSNTTSGNKELVVKTSNSEIKVDFSMD
ncbi:DUF4097 family beta strand repeat-containing protein [Enterococcus sp. CWB-B31]|uniref:DUF4097 family beta strand repeat-containing protein n=1 Tax=Enterococcus sp. CWB-B31 TaxID=2885159 RepID=UPI001E51C742|nr:DUF4097 family beta strand repeat-containing protein [Enterococcus sp. CWB-B31]MCB5955640.1 DUF4097 domain-containing protein [Enterococcus sp. CWB-B31]